MKNKEPLDESERGESKSWLKIQHSENKDHSISSITSWQIDGKIMEMVRDFTLAGGDRGWAPKSLQMMIAAMKLKDAYSLEKSYDQPRLCIKKQRYCFANKGLPSHSCSFSAVMYGGESWTTKKVERQRTDAFELWC